VIGILKLNSIRGSTFSERDKKLKNAFNKVKEEMEEHLQAINENTNEITSNYEYICELEAKVEKLTERLDKMQMFIEEHIGAKPAEAEFAEGKRIMPLNKAEQDIFSTLYVLQEEKSTVTYADIAERTGTDEGEISARISSMTSKGVPISKKFIGNEPYLKLDKEFKTLQAKENVLHIVH